MKGLLWKDVYTIWKTYSLYGLIMLAFLAGGAFLDNSFILLYPGCLVGLIPASLFNIDEKSGWNVYSATLPLPRARLVSVRYLLTLLLSLGTLLLYLLVRGAMVLYRGGGSGAFFTRLSLMFSVELLCPAVMLPCVLKFGYNKGSVAYFVFLGLIFGAMMGGMTALDIMIIAGGTGGSVLARTLLWALPLAAAALFGLSWLLSIRIYEKKEF